jgi:hypothetical protein
MYRTQKNMYIKLIKNDIGTYNIFKNISIAAVIVVIYTIYLYFNAKCFYLKMINNVRIHSCMWKILSGLIHTTTTVYIIIMTTGYLHLVARQ